SALQHGLLFHSLYAPEEKLYFEQLTCVVTLADAKAFVQAWQDVVRRHAILRTSFHWRGLKRPLQVVHEDAELPVDVQDWRGLSEATRQEKLEAYLREDRER